MAISTIGYENSWKPCRHRPVSKTELVEWISRCGTTAPPLSARRAFGFGGLALRPITLV
jgi:hypothetical protein